MTLLFLNHPFQYGVEAVTKMFFPCIRFDHAYELVDCKPDRLIITRMKRGRKHTYLLAVMNLDGKTCAAHQQADRTCEDKNTLERLLCTALYEVLSKMTGIDVQWGLLTGIRPVKQFNYMIQRGVSHQEARRVFRDDYLASEQKTSLCELTAVTQEPLLRLSRDNSYSLYVSIPFCPSRCSYCSFVSSSITNHKARALRDGYVDRLCEELQVISRQIEPFSLHCESIYIGGGTPTALTADQLRRVTDAVSRYFPVNEAREYTIEAGRADSTDSEKLRVIKESGATRISINPQSFDDEVLREIGRKHTSAQVLECYRLAREMGFEEINMDFIAGLPGDTPESFRHTIDTAISLSPSNITVHTLSLKRASDLFSPDGLAEQLRQVQVSKMVGYAYDTLTANGYLPYYLYRQKNTLQNLENVGYGRPGSEGLYNIFIMEEVHTILAAGAGAVSKLIHPDSVKVKRVFNYKYPYEYMDGFDEIINRKRAIHDFYMKNS